MVHLEMIYLLKMVMFNGYISLAEGKVIWVIFPQLLIFVFLEGMVLLWSNNDDSAWLEFPGSIVAKVFAGWFQICVILLLQSNAKWCKVEGFRLGLRFWSHLTWVHTFPKQRLNVCTPNRIKPKRVEKSKSWAARWAIPKWPKHSRNIKRWASPHWGNWFSKPWYSRGYLFLSRLIMATSPWRHCQWWLVRGITQEVLGPTFQMGQLVLLSVLAICLVQVSVT